MGAISATPDFIAADERLLATLRRHSDPDFQVALLKRIARHLGDENYPVFLKLLCVVGESDDATAQHLLAESLRHAIQRDDLPSGTVTSWGVAEAWGHFPPAPMATWFSNAAPRRGLGPIEYLTAWYGQSTNAGCAGKV